MLAQRFGPEKFAEMLEKFGLGGAHRHRTAR